MSETASAPSSGRPSAQRLREVFDLVERAIEVRYDIPVRINDVPSPFTGDLDGAEIHVDFAEEIESAVFIVAHLFGHTVQWNLDSQARAIGLKTYQAPTANELRELKEYEVKACRYSMRLFHDVGVRDLDQWLSDFAACDYRYLEHFYQTGEKRPFKSFWCHGEPLLEPLKIPDFRPQRWVSRWQGIVV